MPEIKHTFLAGKMNKSLDDRLVPEGEYRDAQNIEVTTDIDGGGDIGTVRRVKGNTHKTDTDSDFTGTPEVIGVFFDDKNNTIYHFVTDDSVHKIYKYFNNTRTVLVQDLDDTLLKFRKTSRITGINVIEDYLFWTDNLNPPRRINITNTPTYTEEHQISVVKLAPHKAPSITATVQTQSNIDDDGEAQAGTYMKEKFIRFSYRFKYEDDTYSVLAPFSSFVFSPVDLNNRPNQPDLPLSQSEIESLMGSTEMTWFENKVNRVIIEFFTATDSINNGLTFAEQSIKSIDILAKSSDSPAVVVLDTIDATSLASSTSGTYKYLGSNPKSTLAEDQLIRIYDKAPLRAASQEFVGNRVVYGNYEENRELPNTLPLKGNVVLRSETTNDNRIFPSYSLKFNRTYDVGYVLSDDYGRTTPVLSFLNNRVYNEFPLNEVSGLPQFNRKKISIKVDAADKSDVIDQVNSLMALGWKYIVPVVKQDRQEYYNVYTPGFGNVDGKTYFSLFGDNINKIPVDTSTYNSETNINSTKQKVSLVLENKTTFTQSSESGEPIYKEAIEYDWENYNPSDQGQPVVTQYINGYTNVLGYASGTITQEFNSYTYSQDQDAVSFSNAVTPAPNGTNATFTIRGGSIPDGDQPATGDNTYFNIGATDTENTGVSVYVNGVKKQNGTEYTYDKNNVQITFIGDNIPATGDSIVVFFQYDGIEVLNEQGRSAYSLSTITGTTDRLDSFPENPINVRVTDSNYVDITTSNSLPNRDHDLINLTEIKINGISTRSNFNSISEDIINISENYYGLYKIENNYLLAEVEGEYGVKLYDNSGSFPVAKYADLGILETPGFESSIDIYYETPTVIPLYSFLQTLQYSQDFDVYYDVEYYNAITLSITRYIDSTLNKWQWQENRLRGGFNEPYIDFGVQAHLVNPDYKKQIRQSSLIYSGIYNARTGVNNTNQFPIGENIEKSLDPVHGSIQKLFAEDNDLLVFQQEKVSQIPIDRDIIYTAEGSPQLTTSNRVFGDVVPYAGNYGIGQNPESFAHYAGRKYFVDQPKGAVLRLSRDGITEISNYGMRTYLLQSLNDATKIYGMWDMAKRQYVLSYQGGSTPQTLSFDESSNGWVSFYNYFPEFGGSIDGSFYTFKNGRLYKHYEGTQFYGNNFTSSVDLIMNQNPSASKNFITINYEGTNSWNISSIGTTIDNGLPISAPINSVDDTDTIINLSQFKDFDGKFFANIVNDSDVRPDEISFGSSISGIKGYFLNIKIQTTIDNSELFSVSSNYNINSY